jgi:hypothetical protein
MIPMLHGDKTNAASRLHSTSQTEVKTKENILPRNIGDWIMTNKQGKTLGKINPRCV